MLFGLKATALKPVQTSVMMRNTERKNDKTYLTAVSPFVSAITRKL